MKHKISFYLLLALFTTINSFAQTDKTNNSLTKQQKSKDSIEFEKFKKSNPENFLNKRSPIKLTDENYVVEGFSTGIRMQNNHVKDSVYHNFQPGMPDTTTVNPFNDIEITDSKIKVDLFSHLMLAGGKEHNSAEITSIEPYVIVNNKIGNLPIGDFKSNSTAIKISINGKLLFDWKLLKSFPKQVFKTSEKFLDFGGGNMYGYSYGYKICDTILKINDQLLIEIKNTENNWMIDRYNITRVAMAPELSSIYSINKNKNIITAGGNEILLKKNFTIEADDNKLLLRPFKHSFINNSDIEYTLIRKNATDTSWISVSGLAGLPLQLYSDNDYTLLLRYKFQPESINTYTFNVRPYWWQTALFKTFSVLIFAVILFLSIFYFYKKRKQQQVIIQKQETQKILLEIKAIRSQLNPHFIFNALSSIQGLINSNKLNDANFYLSEFSNLMRNTLTESNEIFHPLEKEIKVLDTYLKLEQLRFQFNYKIDASKNIEINEIDIPCLLLQPLVENAVKHGVSALKEKGKVCINFYKINNDLIAEIKDNGSGFNDKNKPDGYGFKLTDDRIMLLNKMNKDQQIDKKIFRKNDETIVRIIFKNSI